MFDPLNRTINGISLDEIANTSGLDGERKLRTSDPQKCHTVFAKHPDVYGLNCQLYRCDQPLGHLTWDGITFHGTPHDGPAMTADEMFKHRLRPYQQEEFPVSNTACAQVFRSDEGWRVCNKIVGHGLGHFYEEGEHHHGPLLPDQAEWDRKMASLHEMLGVTERRGPYQERVERRKVEEETHATVISSTSGAKSSHQAHFYHLISPHVIERLAQRLTGGGKKYGQVQWRQGINDVEYMLDRYNHFWEHLLKFQASGNTTDDNLGAMLWALHALMECERLCPAVFMELFGVCDVFGMEATARHNAGWPRVKPEPEMR